MLLYCVNKFADHLVHNVDNCDHLPPKSNCTYFYATDNQDAMEKAGELYANASKCFYCMR